MKTVHLLFLFLASLLVEARDLRYVNDYDKPLRFNCPTTQSISGITSEHHNKHEDRRWDFNCRDTFTQRAHCFESGYVNNWDGPLMFECPTNYVVTGMSSVHDNHHEDRRWTFTCCTGSNFCTGNCQWSGYVNHFDGLLNWYAGVGYYLTGAKSYHENKHEDRRWQYQTCQKTC
ncbi:hemagglutinin/amebocyte aggregation factor-like [Alosa pseudoharengus]|uniref:hemagglutinin/amebocyte aggregation factor-like n=1 Tax=Alosa pseudoharengus TaxID=34774 RepID=UPI003F8B9F39